MISKEDLQKPRTPSELKQYREQIFAMIRQDKEIIKAARLRQGLYKNLIEEFYPFSMYCDHKYRGADVSCEIVIGKQGYDGIIKDRSGGEIEYVEITWPIDGHKEKAAMRLLNDRGYTNIEVQDVDYDSERQAIINRIIEKARDKALKDYTFNVTSSLIILIDIYPHFFLDNPHHQKELDNLIVQLRHIPFKVKSVYLILMPVEKIISITDRV